MPYNYAEKEGNFYDEKLSQGVMTQPLETPNVDWLDARSFRVSQLITSGYQPHTRNKGFNPGTLANPYEIYTLEFDRDIEFYVDKADVDETARDLEAARVSATFIESQAQPETDAYRFSKLAWYAEQANKSTTDTISKDTIYTQLKSMILPIRKYGPANILAYISSEAMDALERSTEFTRTITNQNIGTTALDSRVTSLDGVTLIEVWDDDRFKNKFDFTDGFKPVSSTKDINILMVATPAVICKAKFNSVYFFAPGEHTQGDGWLYQNRLYHDLWLLKNKMDAIAVSLKA